MSKITWVDSESLVGGTHTKDKWVERWAVGSDSGDETYTVAMDADGDYGCSCPVWRRFRGKECKHIKMIKMSADTPEIKIKKEETITAKIKEIAKKSDDREVMAKIKAQAKWGF